MDITTETITRAYHSCEHLIKFIIEIARSADNHAEVKSTIRNYIVATQSHYAEVGWFEFKGDPLPDWNSILHRCELIYESLGQDTLIGDNNDDVVEKLMTSINMLSLWISIPGERDFATTLSYALAYVAKICGMHYTVIQSPDTFIGWTFLEAATKLDLVKIIRKK